MRSIALSILCAITIAAYWPALHSPFVFDDEHAVIGEPSVIGAGPIAVGHSPRFFAVLGWRILYGKFGQNPIPFHAWGLFLHLLNGFLVWICARKVFEFSQNASLLCTGLFLLHPAQSQAVIYISQQCELLCLAGILASVICFSGRRYVWAFVFLAIAVMSKETGLVTPVLWLLCSLRNGRVSAKASIAIGAACAFSLVNPQILSHIRTIGINAQFFAGHSYATVALLSKFVWPFGLTIDHDFSVIRVSAAAVSALALVAAGIFGILYRRSIYGFSTLWILVLVLPHVLAEPDAYLAEHHLYAPSFAVCLLLTCGIEALTRPKIKFIEGESHV